VFVPVALMEGMVGQFFKEFGITIVVSVVLSLWVAFTLDPMLSAKFGGHHKPLPGRFWDAWRSLLTRADQAAGRLAAWAFVRPWRVGAFATVLLVGSGALLLSRGADFLAFEDRGQLVVDITAPSGTPKEGMLALADQAHERLKGLDGLVDVYTKTGGLRNNDTSKAEMRLVFVPKTQRDKGLIALQKEANERLEGLGAKFLVMEPPPIEGIGSEAPLAIYLYGDDYTQLFTEAERIEGEIAKLAGVGRVRLETRPIVPGIDISLDPGELGFWHTSASTVELTGRLALTGLEAGSVGADNVPLMVRYREDARTLDALWNSTYVPTPKGPVLLSQLAQAGDSQSPTSIDRERRSRKVVIWATMDRSRSYGLVLADVEKLLASVPAPMFGEIAGDKEFFEEMTSNFAIAIVGSAFFIFVILAIQFESLLRPFIIILTLPLAAIGAFLALFVAGEKLALGALIGIILLIGLAAKNGILLVDAASAKEKELGLLAAVRRAVEERFRPIVMTSVAMIFGMLPTAVMRGGGSEFRSPMAIAIIGGVISSTLLSLVIVPAVFGLLEKLGAARERLTKASGKRRPAAAAAAVVVVLAVAGALWGQAAEAQTPTSGKAAASAKPAASAEKRADMAQIKSILREPLSPEGAEALSILAARSAAEGLTTASWLAFGGVMKAEAGRQWTRPGVEQEVTLPLPPQIGGPVTTKTTVVPKQQDVVELSWGLPLFNMQVIRGLEVASQAREQQGLVEKLQKEAAAQTKAQLLLQYEMAAKLLRVQKERARIAEERLKMVESRTGAGIARRIQLDEATANLEAARADLERARAGLTRAHAAFASESSAPLPDDGLGLPQFPLAEGRPLNAQALAALRGSERIQEAQVSVNDAAFLPTLEAGAAHQRKLYDGGPEPQNVVSLKLSWTLLDAGTRRRNAAEQTSALYRAKAQTASLAKELKVAHDTLPARVAGARHGLAARQAALRAAESAVEDSLAAYRSGAGQLLDVRNADEMRLTAELAVYQAEIELQGLALESLVLSGGLLDYIGS
jgi:outer membrane protein TolC